MTVDILKFQKTFKLKFFSIKGSSPYEGEKKELKSFVGARGTIYHYP